MANNAAVAVTPEPVVGSLSSRGMLVDLTISYWVARAEDKKASRDAEFANDAQNGSGKFHKHLINIKAQTYRDVKETAREVRAWHYWNTLPWSNAARCLPSNNYLAYTDGLRKRIDAFNLAVDVFMDDIHHLTEEARVTLGKMFRETDYPSREQMRVKFGIHVDIYPLPDAGDFRAHLADDQVSAIKQQIEAGVKRSTELAMRDAWTRLHEQVAHMVERLSKPDALFRDTLVGNVRELCDLLPRLNLTDDPTLKAMGAEVKRRLGAHDAESLREDKHLRAKVAADAEALARKMAGLFGGAR